MSVIDEYIPGYPGDLSRSSIAAEEFRRQDLAGIVELPHLASVYGSSALRWGATPEEVAAALVEAFTTGRAA